MTGDDVLVKILKAEGVQWLSCFPAQTLIDAASREGIRPILCRQERAGVNMADGYSRIHNGKKIGVFTMQTGPVLLECPRDVATAEFPQDTFTYMPVKVLKSGAAPEDVREVVTALLKASQPIINAGQGVLYAEATPELIAFAELTHIPVMTTLAGKSAFPETHPLALGTGASSGTQMVHDFLQATDFVLGIGTSFTLSNFNAPMPTHVPLAQVTNCAEDVNKDYRVSYGAIGDAKIVLQQMIEEAKRQLGAEGRGDVHGTVATIAKSHQAFMAEWGPRLVSDEVPISPYRVIHELAHNVDVANTILTHDSGYPREQTVPFWRPVRPRGYIGWGKSTQLGYGLGLAMGAKVAAPDKTVVNIMGDAAFGMAGMDIETAARAGLGTLTIILNNGVMTHYHAHFPHAAKHWESNKLGGHYAKVADGLGAYAERVETPDQVGPAIQRGLAATKKGQPAVLEMLTKEEETIPRYWR